MLRLKIALVLLLSALVAVDLPADSQNTFDNQIDISSITVTITAADESASSVLQRLSNLTGRTIRLAMNADNQSDKPITLDVHQQNLWSVLGKICQQLDLGLSIHNEIQLSASEMPLRDYVIAGSFLIAACERTPEDALEKDGPQLDLRVQYGRDDLHRSEISLELMYGNNQRASLKPIGYETGNGYLEWYFLLPQQAEGQRVRLKGEIQSRPIVDRETFKFDVTGKNLESPSGIALRILNVQRNSKSELGSRINMELTWDSGFSEEEFRRFNEINNAVLAGENPTQEQTAWLNQHLPKSRWVQVASLDAYTADGQLIAPLARGSSATVPGKLSLWISIAEPDLDKATFHLVTGNTKSVSTPFELPLKLGDRIHP